MAAAAWLALTFSAYLVSCTGIIRHRGSILLACADAGLANAVVGRMDS
jgi:hypothetical protein